MQALDIVMGMPTGLHQEDAIGKLKIVRTLQAKLLNYASDLIIPVVEEDETYEHPSAAQISGRTRSVVNDELINRENYILEEVRALAALKTYLAVTPTLDEHHIKDVFDELQEHAANVIPIADRMNGQMIMGMVFSRLKLRHFIENGRIEDQFFLNVLDFPMFERRTLVRALLRSGGLDILLTGYKERLMKYNLDTLDSTSRRMNHYLTRLFSEIIDIRKGGGSYLDMIDKDISRDEESRILRLLEQMEHESPFGGDEFIFAMVSDCYLQGLNLFR